MIAIDILVEEHENINRLNRLIQAACLRVLGGAEVPIEDFRKMIEFIRNYADKHHHGKEEQLLFRDMQEELGAVAEKLIRNGMLVEHDLARLHVMEWEKALDRYATSQSPEDKLDILTYAMGYSKLLIRHIGKENDVVYTFAERHLSPEVLRSLNERTEQFEQEAAKENTQDKYLGLLSELEKNYL